MPERVSSPVLRRDMVLDVFDKFVAVASHDDLSARETVAFKYRLSYALAVLVIDSVNRIVEHDHRRSDAQTFC
ncbi:hypothetical protein D3C80_2061430 [compost metagenome]